MAISTIPLNSKEHNVRFSVQLDGQTFEMYINWNLRDQAYYMSVVSQNDEPIILGRKLSSDLTILSGISKTTRPLGSLFMFDTSNLNRPPEQGELGTLFELIYVDYLTALGLD